MNRNTRRVGQFAVGAGAFADEKRRSMRSVYSNAGGIEGESQEEIKAASEGSEIGSIDTEIGSLVGGLETELTKLVAYSQAETRKAENLALTSLLQSKIATIDALMGRVNTVKTQLAPLSNSSIATVKARGINLTSSADNLLGRLNGIRSNIVSMLNTLAATLNSLNTAIANNAA